MTGTLTDTGPLYALIDRDDAYHAAAASELDHIALPLLTTWSCLTEAMHFLKARLGRHGQEALADMVLHGDVAVVESEHHALTEVLALMDAYQDAPMDLADASLVAAASALGTDEVFTFDDHFQAYRLRNKRPFRVVPTPRR